VDGAQPRGATSRYRRARSRGRAVLRSRWHHAALEAFSDSLQRRFPEARFTLASPPQVLGDALRTYWTLGPLPNGKAADGLDFVLLDGDKVRTSTRSSTYRAPRRLRDRRGESVDSVNELPVAPHTGRPADASSNRVKAVNHLELHDPLLNSTAPLVNITAPLVNRTGPRKKPPAIPEHGSWCGETHPEPFVFVDQPFARLVYRSGGPKDLCRFRAKCQAIAWFCATAANLDASSGAGPENASTRLTIVHHRNPVLKRGQRVKHFSERLTGPSAPPCSRVLRNLSAVLRSYEVGAPEFRSWLE
jgi:hypothetical protein